MEGSQTSLSQFWGIPGITSSIIKSHIVRLTSSFAMTKQKSIITPCFTISVSDIFIPTMRKEVHWVFLGTFSWCLGALNSRTLAATYMTWNVSKILTPRAIITISLSKTLRYGAATQTRNLFKVRLGPRSWVNWRKIHSINLSHLSTSSDRTLYLRSAKTWLYPKLRKKSLESLKCSSSIQLTRLLKEALKLKTTYLSTLWSLT